MNTVNRHDGNTVVIVNNLSDVYHRQAGSFDINCGHPQCGSRFPEQRMTEAEARGLLARACRRCYPGLVLGNG